jgi:DNA-binding LytR/AlgR family response regulator
MKAIIVDDEPKAIELLKNYLVHFSQIELVNTFRNGLKAFEYLSSHRVDLIFLDINMPHLSGISFSKMIDSSTKIVFTTAYSEYAAESYEVNAVDYLLKPISLERFTKAMGRVLNENVQTPRKEQENIIIVKSGSKRFRLREEEILYLEKDGNYMIYHLADAKILSRESIRESLRKLPHHFIQSHRSYIVNINKVAATDNDYLMIHQQSIPISNTYKKGLMDLLNIS